jgi:leucyl/phenylalanyl-tRNA---protein transferase
MNSKSNLNSEDLLKPEKMLKLYSIGAFPMTDDNDFINWYLPDVRCIIPLDNYNIPRSLKKVIEKSQYKITTDKAILDVILNCANRKLTWINKRLIEAYKDLMKFNAVHSVEIWDEKKLVGGLYGIAIKGAFFGESMFSIKPQTSKIALAFLIKHLIKNNFVLLDVQYQTEHLAMFGTKEISYENYELFLKESYLREVNF